jgi:hypothetical protein
MQARPREVKLSGVWYHNTVMNSLSHLRERAGVRAGATRLVLPQRALTLPALRAGPSLSRERERENLHRPGSA